MADTIDDQIKAHIQRVNEANKNSFLKKRLVNGVIKLLSKEENNELNKRNYKKAKAFSKYKQNLAHIRENVRIKFKPPK